MARQRTLAAGLAAAHKRTTPVHRSSDHVHRERVVAE
jgi:hypothetical protein